MNYKVIQEFDKYKVGQIVNDENNYYILEKVREGGCLEPILDSGKKSVKVYENKSITDIENKLGIKE